MGDVLLFNRAAWAKSVEPSLDRLLALGVEVLI
jgi:hypothetical protein